MLSRMNRRCVHQIHKHNENEFTILGANDMFKYYVDENKVCVIDKVPKHSDFVLYNSNETERFLITTTGRGTFTDNNTGEVLKIINLGHELFGTATYFDNEFLYESKNYDIIKTNKYKSVVCFKNSPGYRLNTLTNICGDMVCFTNVYRPTIYFIPSTDINFCKLGGDLLKIKHSFNVDGEPHRTACVDAKNKLIYFGFFVPFGEGFRNDLLKVNYDTFEHSFVFGSIEISEKLFSDISYFKISPNGENVALFDYFDKVTVIHLADLQTVCSYNLNFLSVLEWIDDSTLLVGTWTGLFKMTIND